MQTPPATAMDISVLPREMSSNTGYPTPPVKNKTDFFFIITPSCHFLELFTNRMLNIPTSGLFLLGVSCILYPKRKACFIAEI